MIDIKKVNFATKKLLSNKSAQLGDSGLIRGSSSEGTLDVTSRKFFAGFLSVLAIIVWIVDILEIPYIGGVYSGFNFDPQDFWNNWLISFTFGNVFFDAVLVLTILFLVVKYVRDKTIPNPVDVISIFLGLLAVIFLLTNPAWMSFPKAVFHFLLIITFSIYVWRTSSISAGFLVLFGLIFFDFFLFSTLLKFIPFFQYISLLGAIIIAITFGQSPTGVTGTSFFLLLLFIIVMTVANGTPAQGVLFTESEFQKASLNEVLDKLTTGISNYQRQISLGVQRQIQFAITGKVEENQYEPLGVYLEDIKSAQSRFYTDESVVVWGNVRARTLDDPINIKLGCYVGDKDDNNFASKVSPNKTFSVFTLEEQDFACSFNPNFFESGSETITTFADFNFETLAFLKVYFMDRERLRAMTRENLDPFEEFGIQDKNPVAIYTNGPAEIGMETTSSLIGVSTSYLALPRLSVSIQNRQGWEGKITALKELILLLPKGIKIADPQTDCNQQFNKYEITDCKERSCQELVHNECMAVCVGFNLDSLEKVNCEQSCGDKRTTCENDCELLFLEEDQKYNGYELDIAALRIKVRKEEDLEKFRFFTCSINPTPSEVLENTPITTKSFRVKARYNYTVEKTVSVRIEKIPGLDERAGDKVREITGTNDVHTRVIELANQMSSNPILVVAIAKKESSFKHCKIKPCGTSNKENVNCNSAGSCGVMQINREARAHPDLFEVGTLKLNRYKCNVGKTAYDLDCNIKSGIGVLQDNFNIFGNDEKLYNAAVDANCNLNNNPELNKKYKEYTNAWDRALRAYNGFGCTKGADIDYVDEVNKLKK